MNCENFEHMRVERGEGLLGEADAIALDAHLSECAACRAAAAEFGAIGDRLDAAGAAFGSTRLAAPGLAAHVEPAAATVHGAGRAARSPRGRRVARWVAALAGTAAVAAVVILPLALIDRTASHASAAPSLASMAQAMNDARNIQFEIHLVPQLDVARIATDVTVEFGRMTVVREVQVRLDMSDGRTILTDTSSGRTQIRLANEKKFIELPLKETAERAPVKLYDALVGLADNPTEDLGIELLDGILARVFLVRDPGHDLAPGEYKVWINPYTSLPMKVEVTGRMTEVAASGIRAPELLVLDNFAFGLAVDRTYVELALPDGLTEAPITADPLAARVETSAAARTIMMGLTMVQNDTGQWPASLQTLIDGGQVSAEKLANPRGVQGTAQFGWIYLPPPADAQIDDRNRLVLTEPPTEPWTEVVVAFGDGHVEVVNDRARYDELMVAAGGAAMQASRPELDRSTAVTVDPSKFDKPGAVALSGNIPLVTLNKDDLNGLSVEGNRITEGDAKFHTARLRENPHLPRELQVNKFLATDDTLIASLSIGSDNTAYGLLTDAAGAIERDKQPVLIDKLGQRFPVLGFVHSTGDVVRVRYYPNKPVASIDDLPAVSASKPHERLHLVFRVSAGSDIVGFAVGNKLVASFKPVVSTKAK